MRARETKKQKNLRIWWDVILREPKPQRQVQEQDLKGRLAAQACIKKIKVKIKTVFHGKDLLKLIA